MLQGSSGEMTLLLFGEVEKETRSAQQHEILVIWEMWKGPNLPHLDLTE